MRLKLFVLVSFLISYQAIAQDKITLEEVIALALEKNYDVRLAENASSSARLDKTYSAAALLPQVNAVGATVWTKNHQEFEFADESRNVSGDAKRNDVTGSIQLVWTLFDGTRMFATRERLSEISSQGEINVKNQMVNSIFSVITNYYGIVRQKQQLQAIQEQMSVNEERVKLAERKLQVGTGGKPELLQAKVDLNAQRTLALQQETLIQQLKDQLNGLVGLQLPPTFDVSDSINIDLGISQEEIASDIERRNFGLLSAQQSLSIAKTTLWERRAERSPTINFNAAFNYSQTDNIKLINPFSSLASQIDGYNYGFTINVPIFNGLNTHRLTQQARITVDRQQLFYEQQRQLVDVSIRNAYVNYDNAKKILSIEEENISLAKENVAIALEGFRRGVSTFIELRTAQQSLADAYNRLITARYNAKIAETELLRLNGSLLK